MVRKLLVLIAVAIPLTLVACGGDDSSSTTAASDTSSSAESTTSTTADTGGGSSSVDLSETEFKIDPADATAKAGSVTFAVKNDGSIVHDLEVEGNGVEESTDPIEAGSSDELTVDLKPGTYTIYCNIADHRAEGMEGTLTVQ